MKTRKVTVRLLLKLGANCEGVDEFSKVFPKGAEITLENCLKAAEHHLDIDWFALNYLEAQALEAYEKAKAQAFYNAWRS